MTALTATLKRGSASQTLSLVDDFAFPDIGASSTIIGGAGPSDPVLVRETVGPVTTLTLPIYVAGTSQSDLAGKLDTIDAFLRGGACTLELVVTGSANTTYFDVFYAQPVQPLYNAQLELGFKAFANIVLQVAPFARKASTALYSAKAKATPVVMSLTGMTTNYRTPLTIDVESATADDLHSLYVAYLPSAVGIAVSSIDTGTEVITLAANHGWAAGDRVFVSAATLPGGLSTAISYYVLDPSGATLKLSLTAGGAAVNITSSGTSAIVHPGMSPLIDAKNLTWTGSGETSYADSYARLDNAVEFQSTDYNPATIDTSAYPEGDYLILARVKAVGTATGYLKTDYTDEVTWTRTSFHYIEAGTVHLPVKQVRGTSAATITVSLKSSSASNGQEAVLDHLVFLPLSWGMWSYHPTTATVDVTEVGYDPTIGVTYVDDVADGQYANNCALMASTGALLVVSDNPEGTTRTHSVKVSVSYYPRYAYMR